jgi:fibronectin-binding autotransporter adhesin
MKPRLTSSRRLPPANFIVFCLGLASAALMTPSAQAATGSWTGLGSDSLWSTAGNWSGATPPGTGGQIATFNDAGNAKTTIDLNTGVPVSNIVFDTASAAAYTIGAGAAGSQNLTLNTSITMNSTVVNNQLLNSNVLLNAATNTFTNNSTTNTLTFAGGISSNSAGAKNLAIAGTGITAISGNITAGAGTVGISKSGAGTLNLSGTNALTGYTSSSGTLQISGGSTTVDTAMAYTSTGTHVTVSGGSLIASGGITTSGNSTVRTLNLNGGTLQSGGNIFANTLAANVAFNGGTLQSANPAGINLYDADSAILVNAAGATFTTANGNITVNGAISYTAAGSAVTMTGAGTVGVTGNLTTSSNSTSRFLNLNGGTLRADGSVFADTLAVGVGFNGGTLASGNVAGTTIFDSDNQIVINSAGGTFDTTIGDITLGTNTASANVVKTNGNTGGAITVKGGKTLKSAVTNTGVLALQDSSTWDMDSDSTVASSVGGLSGATGTIINSGAADQALTLALSAGSPTFGGIISNSGGANIRLVKSGAGDQTLSGNNLLTQTDSTTNVGAVTVSGGTLTLSGNNTLTSNQTQGGNLIAITGGTLVLTGTNTLSATSLVNGIIAASGGILSVNSFANNLGGATTLNMGAGSGDAGTVLYTGTGETTALEFGSTSASVNAQGIIDQSGTGHLAITGNYTPNGTTLITLQGSTAGTAEFAGDILDSVNVTALTKQGTGTWTLSGSNSYSGDTTVLDGVLVLAGNSSIVDAGKLVINGGKVAPTGNETVGTLFFGASQQAAGTWGSTSSTATNTDNTRFSGTGVITVLNGAPGGYSSWDSNVGGQTAGEDFNNDGVDNGIAYFMNNTGRITLPGIVGGGVTWTNGGNIPASAYGTQFVVQTSQNLATWTNVLVGGLTTNTDSTLTYTLPTSQGKWFVRLVVSPN